MDKSTRTQNRPNPKPRRREASPFVESKPRTRRSPRHKTPGPNRAGHVREHTLKGPQGGAYPVLTITERGVERAERIAREQGLDPEQKAWSGLVKPRGAST